jgi:hypothetical protein
VLALYGGGGIVRQVMTLAGVFTMPADMDWRSFHGHLYLWNPWFLLWGLLLALTTRTVAHRP